jgi:hypothetical protein
MGEKVGKLVGRNQKGGWRGLKLFANQIATVKEERLARLKSGIWNVLKPAVLIFALKLVFEPQLRAPSFVT